MRKQTLKGIAVFFCLAAALFFSPFFVRAETSGIISEGITWRIDGDGVLYIEGEGEILTSCDDEFSSGNWTEITGLVISEGITSADFNATGVETLTFVRLPDSLSSAPVFSECSALSDVDLGNGLTTIRRYMFSDCTALTEIAVPASVKTIESFAFDGCTSLETVTLYDGLEGINNWAFSESAIKTIDIPQTVKAVGISAFDSCAELETVTLHEGLEKISSYAFAGTGIKEITVPGSAELEMYIFDNCQALTKIVFSQGISQLYRSTFAENKTLPNLETLIYYGAFNEDGEPSGCVNDSALFGYPKLKTLVLGDGVRRIDSDAFANCTALENVTFGNGRIDFYDYAFANTAIKELYLPAGADIRKTCFVDCDEITKIEFAEGFKSIPAEAFSELPNLETVIIRGRPEEEGLSPSSVGARAFYGCPKLKTLVLDQYVYGICEYAFADCTSLENVTLNGELQYIDSYAFQNCAIKEIVIPGGAALDKIFDGCDSLTKIVVTEVPYPTFYAYLSGADAFGNINSLEEFCYYGAFDYDGDPVGHVSGLSGLTKLTKVTLGEGVGSIESGAFQNCTSLETLPIHDGIRYIGDYAFANTAVTEVVIPNAGLGVHIFDGCTRLTKITVSEGVDLIDSSTFYNIENLETLIYYGSFDEDGSSYASIGSGAFLNFTNLETVILGSGVFAIDDFAFSGCTSLKNVTLSEGLCRIGTYAFENCPIEEITIPGTVFTLDNSGVLFPFYGCDQLKKVTVCEGVQCIGSFAFNGLESLETLIYHGAYDENGESFGHIQDGAFNECPNLKTVYLGSGVWSVGEYAFAECPLLKNVTLCEGVSSLGYSAFGSCAIEEIVIPGTVYIFGQLYPENMVYHSVFGGCKNLKEIVFSEGIEEICGFQNLEALETVVIPNSVTTIAEDAFNGCTKLKNVSIGSGVETIGKYAFAYCDLGNITFAPTDGTVIFQGAFASSGITKCALPKGYTLQYYTYYDEVSPFSGCNELREVYFSEDIEKIDEMCFISCEKLEKVVLPKVKYIEENAFAWCTALKTVGFGDCLDYVGEYAFYNCTSLEEVVLPESTTAIQGYAFYRCSGMKKLVLNENLLIYPEAFTGIGVTELYIPASAVIHSELVEDCIEYLAAFKHCPNLERVIFEDGRTEIPDCLFFECYNLSYIEFPDTLETIGDGAFYNTALNTLVLPASARYIGGYVAGEYVKNVVFEGDAPLYHAAFFQYEGDHTLYFPEEYRENFINSGLPGEFSADYGYTLDKDGNMVISDIPSESRIAAKLKTLKEKYPEGYAINSYTIGSLKSTDLIGYGSQAFAFILSNELFGYLPASCDSSVSFAEVKVGDILSLDGESLFVVVTEKTSSGVTVVQGDWRGAATFRLRAVPVSGSVHWGEKLTKAQVESADYRITRYESDLNSDLSAVSTPVPEYSYSPDGEVTEDVAYDIILSHRNTFPEGLPFDMGISYVSKAEIPGTDGQEFFSGDACLAFSLILSDRIFGDAPIRYIEGINFDDIMVGDILHYDPDPNDNSTHVVVVMEVYKDRVITVEGNYGGTVHWGSMFTREEVEAMLGYYTRYASGATHGERQDFDDVHKCESFHGWYLVSAPDCENRGEEIRYCAVCGKSETRYTDALGHNWKEATCTAAKTCASCGKTSGNPKEHNWREGTCTTAKTCKTCGTTTGGVVHTYSHQYDYKCDLCGETRVVDMTRPMVDMYRMYNPNTGEHFYTGSTVERDTLISVGWQYEGIGFTFPLTTGAPVHRLFQPSTGEHLYTMDEDEKAKLMAEGWNYEGIAFNSGFENEVPQFRLHNPNATVGAYHFTASTVERDVLISAGWEYQGIGWYSLGGN